jgi:hypothetical protein
MNAMGHWSMKLVVGYISNYEFCKNNKKVSFHFIHLFAFVISFVHKPLQCLERKKQSFILRFHVTFKHFHLVWHISGFFVLSCLELTGFFSFSSLQFTSFLCASMLLFL